MISDFTFKVNGLSVEFSNSSTGNPFSFLWDFGDGNTSTEVNPSHTYSFTEGGYLSITLSVKDEEGEIVSTRTRYLGVSKYGLTLPKSPLTIIKSRIPTGVTYTDEEIEILISYWQANLQPVVKSKVEIDNTYNEFRYSLLENNLIIALVLHSLIIEQANKYLMSVGAGNRTLKRSTIEPAELEWFSNSDLWKGIFDEGGLFQELKNNVCYLAKKAEVFLGFCPQEGTPILPQVFYGSTE